MQEITEKECKGERESRSLEKLNNWKDFLMQEDGMGTVEVILIIVVLVGLVLIFKEQITKIVNSIFNKITAQTNKV